MSRLRRKARSRVRSTRSVSNSSGYSRRVKKEKNRVMTQSLGMLIVAIVVGLAFIFVIIPGFFNLVNNFFDSSTPFQETDDVPPQVPIISAPVNATNSAQIKLTGFGEPESDVIIVLNGSKEEPIEILEDGSFEIVFNLDEGENTISAYGRDKAENESTVTREYITLLDTKPPILELIEPEDDASFESRSNQSIDIKGKTDEGTGVKVYINNRIVFPNIDGEFTHTFRLAEGENKVEIRAEDKAGNASKLEATYQFKL